MISRRRLLRKLEQVAPAVAKSDKKIPIYTYYCFTGRHLLAYNDRIALRTSLETTFQGCLPAALFTDLLQSSRAPAVELLAEDAHALLKLGNARIKVAMCPAEDFFSCFKMPAPPNENIIAGIRGQFFSAIERCLLSSTERPPAFGITLIPGDQKVKLFSTDGRTMTYEQLELTTRVRLRERLILPTAFCKQMLRLAKTAQTTRLAFGKDHALFAADDTLLFTPTLRNLVNPLPFESVLQRHMPNRLKAKFVAIPKPKLGLMLQRALSCRIRGRDRSNPWRRDAFTKVKVHNNVIEFFSQSDRGVVLDETDVPDHPNVEEVKVRPDLLLKAYAWADKMLVTKKSVLLATDDMHTLCVIAVEQQDGA